MGVGVGFGRSRAAWSGRVRARVRAKARARVRIRVGPVAGQHEAGRPASGRGEGVGRHGRLARADLVRDRDGG